MNSLAIAMVKNEADIVEAFVRHNLEFLDLMVVIDNGSTDGTRDILTALQREGLPVLVFDDPLFGYFQSEKVSHVYRKVAPVFQPELVWFLDADEFIHAPSRAALSAALASVPVGGAVLLPWRTQLPDEDVDMARLLADPLGAMPQRRRHEEPTYYKVVLRRDPRDDACLVVEQGNHQVHRGDGQPLATHAIAGAAVAHLPVRSVEQLSAKVINGWQAYLVKNRHAAAPTAGFQWRQLYERIVHGNGLDAATLCEVALDYAQSPRPGRTRACDAVHDPVPARYGPLRHLSLARTSLLAKIALNMESFILNGDGSMTAPVPGSMLAPRRDLCGLLEVLRQAAAVRLRGAAGGARGGTGADWVRELSGANPAWQDAGQGDADLLLAPELPVAAFTALAADAAAHPLRRVVWWPPAAASADAQAFSRALEAWYEAGWEPQLLETLGYRALSAFPELRQGALVLHAAEPARRERALAVRSALCRAAATPVPAAGADLPRRVLHPLQDLRLPD